MKTDLGALWDRAARSQKSTKKPSPPAAERDRPSDRHDVERPLGRPPTPLPDHDRATIALKLHLKTVQQVLRKVRIPEWVTKERQRPIPKSIVAEAPRLMRLFTFRDADTPKPEYLGQLLLGDPVAFCQAVLIIGRELHKTQRQPKRMAAWMLNPEHKGKAAKVADDLNALLQGSGLPHITERGVEEARSLLRRSGPA